MKKIALMTVLGALLVSPMAFAEEGATKGERRGGHDMMKAADTDGDGNISKAEFAAIGEKHFARMDKNGDGVLSPDERPDPSKFKGRRGGGRGGEGGDMPPPPPEDGVPNVPAE